jgi:glutamyl-tRNA synthetase
MDFANDDIDDLVILRSDGSPIYNLAVVSDDAEQGITHVVRGDDHLSNTPKQILLYEALGLEVPTFGHVPMILGPDGKRLSKRHGATAVGEYAKEGILPEAMVNFLALLGWNPGDEREVMERAELVEAFSMERVQKKSAVFDVDKLSWLNGQYLARKPAGELVPLVEERLAARDIDASAWSRWRLDDRAGAVSDRDPLEQGSGAWFEALVGLLQVRARSVDEMADQALPFLVDDPPVDERAVAKRWFKEPEVTVERLAALAAHLGEVPWQEAPLEAALRALADELDVGAGKLIHPLRVALTGQGSSPGIFEVLVLLGRERSLMRIRRAMSRIRDGVSEDS